MTAAKKASPSAPATPANAYEQTRQIMEQTGQYNLAAPLMKQLNKLLEDPVLRKTMEGMPATNGASGKPEKIN